MNKIMYYAKNILGTNASLFHWPEFHSLLSNSNIFDLKSTEIRNNIVNNQHLLNCFSTERTEAFVKHWLYNTLQADWHWFRYEFTVNRGSIHVHGVAKLKSDPGLCEFSKIAVLGHETEDFLKENIGSLSNPGTDYAKIQAVIQAEKSICQYHDFLISCSNPIDSNDWEKPSRHPCKVSFFDNERFVNEDYIDLVNTVQRHTKCNSSYCLKTDKNGDKKCRFDFPKKEMTLV